MDEGMEERHLILKDRSSQYGLTLKLQPNLNMEDKALEFKSLYLLMVLPNQYGLRIEVKQMLTINKLLKLSELSLEIKTDKKIQERSNDKKI